MSLDNATRSKVDTIYVTANDRYVVSLIVGYTEDDLRATDHDAWVAMSSEEQAREAAKWALALTRDEGSHATSWHVYDRQEGVEWSFEQEEFEPADEYF